MLENAGVSYDPKSLDGVANVSTRDSSEYLMATSPPTKREERTPGSKTRETGPLHSPRTTHSPVHSCRQKKGPGRGRPGPGWTTPTRISFAVRVE